MRFMMLMIPKGYEKATPGTMPDAKAAVHHLVLGLRRRPVFGLGAVLEAHEHLDLGAKRALVELDRLLGATVEEQVGLDLHGVSFSGLG